VLRPQVRQLLGREHYRTQLAGLWLRDAATLNGTSPLTGVWVQCLAQLTGRTDLAGLTMLRWAKVVAATGLLRTTRAWCARCYAEAPDGMVYDRLLWALEPVTICAQHQRVLDEHCPTCGRTQHMLAPHARPGYCSWCGAWLGSDSDATHATALGEPDQWQAWVAQAVGALIAAAPGLATEPPRDQVQRVVTAMVERMPWRRVSALARLLETTGSAVAAWRTGRCVPQLVSLLRLSASVALLPHRLLTDPTVVGTIRTIRINPYPAPPLPRWRPYRRFDADAVAVVLQQAVAASDEPPASLRAVGRRVGVDATHLRVRFPALCQTISARYRSYWTQHKQRRLAQLEADIRRAVLQVHGAGRYPTHQRVAQCLGKPGLMRAPEARAMWRQMLRELGWGDVPDATAGTCVGAAENGTQQRAATKEETASLAFVVS